MARCGRCGADSAWIIGDPPKMSRDEEVDALRAKLAEVERERDEVVRQARLSSLNATPEFEDARPIEVLADLMRHLGYADGDSGYTFRYLSYAEMAIIRDALLNHTALADANAAIMRLQRELDRKGG